LYLSFFGDASMNDTKTTLLILRVIWAALLGGILVVAGILTAVTLQMPGDSPISMLLLLIGIGVAVVAIGAGYLMRSVFYKAAWQEHAVTPAGYFQANLVLMATLEAAAIVNLVLMVVSGAMIGHLAVTTVCLVLHAINFPTGRAMQTTEPRSGDE
jgi:hypothetical protein